MEDVGESQVGKEQFIFGILTRPGWNHTGERGNTYGFEEDLQDRYYFLGGGWRLLVTGDESDEQEGLSTVHLTVFVARSEKGIVKS